MYNREKKIILFSILTFLLWTFGSAYWYVCKIRGFCQIKKNNQNIEREFIDEKVDYSEKNIGRYEAENLDKIKKEEIVNTINPYSTYNRFQKQKVRKVVTQNFIIGKKEDSIFWNVDGGNKKRIKCLTYINTKIYPKKKNLPEEVVRLEKFLNEFYNAGVEENGLYEDIDVSFVKLFQKEYMLNPDGIVGNKTVNYINALECLKENGYYKKILKNKKNIN